MNHIKMENYLRRLETAAQYWSAVDRAKLISHSEQHIQKALRDSNKSLEYVLKEMGDPAQFARRFMLAENIRPLNIPRTRRLKAILFSMLAMFLLFILAGYLVIQSFLPIVDFNEETGEVSFWAATLTWTATIHIGISQPGTTKKV